jgi:hypothetical protein
MYKLCDDPPRYPENNELSGYMAGRGDFHVEYDNFMELEIKNLTFDDDDEENKMQLGVLDVYYDFKHPFFLHSFTRAFLNSIYASGTNLILAQISCSVSVNLS